jgi:hypothetical protein
MARSINHPAGATRSINDGPPFFSIASTATVYQNLGNTGISVYASGQALANAFASSVAWGDEEPIANPAFPALHAAATLGVADQLKDGPKSYDTVAQGCGAHPRSLYRLLRALGIR